MNLWMMSPLAHFGGKLVHVASQLSQVRRRISFQPSKRHHFHAAQSRSSKPTWKWYQKLRPNRRPVLKRQTAATVLRRFHHGFHRAAPVSPRGPVSPSSVQRLARSSRALQPGDPKGKNLNDLPTEVGQDPIPSLSQGSPVRSYLRALATSL